MPTKHYALESGGPERLEVSWKGQWKNFTLGLDGRVLGSFENQKELKEGGRFDLGDGTQLEVRLAQRFLFPELQLSRDGEPLPGSAADPSQRLGAAYGMIFFVAAFNMVLGLIAGALNVAFLQQIGLGFGAFAAGILYGVLGFFVKRRSTAALAIAVGLFVLDGIFFLVLAAKGGRTPNAGGLVARVFFLIPMIGGFGAIRALEEAEAAPRRPPRATSPRTSPPAAKPAPATAAAARTLTGEAERRRLDLTTAAAPTVGGTGPGRRFEMKTRSEVDSAASALRFVARKIEITPAGLQVSYPDGKAREAAWAQIAGLVIRLLPPDPPWNAQPLLDAVVAGAGGTWEALRVFSTTIVNYSVLPGGASTSRLENVRKLGAHVAAQNPACALDPETAAFVKEGKPPARFVNTTHFAEYDARYK